MNKTYTTTLLIIFIIMIITITPRLVQSTTCNDQFTLCWQCSNMGGPSSATFKENLKALLLSFPTAKQSDVGYYNMTKGGTEPDDKVTVIALCRGDLGVDCQTCLQNASAVVLGNCPSKKEAIMWGEECMVQYSNDSTFHLMDEEPLLMLVNSKTYVDSETFNGGLKFLLDKLIQYASSSTVALYASGYINITVPKGIYPLASSNINITKGIYPLVSGYINITESKGIYSLIQCIPSLSQKECSDCLNDSSSKILDCCAGVIGARVLKPSCILRYESSGMFYTTTNQTFNQTYLLTTPLDTSPSPDPARAAAPPDQHLDPPRDPARAAAQPDQHLDPPRGRKKKIVTGVVSTVIGMVLLIISIWIFLKIRRNKPTRENLLEIGSVELSQFDFITVKAATEDFKYKLGQGGFGPVYKGKHNGKIIAVKRLSKTSQQGDLEFKNEVELVANLQHRNLVRLLGFCLDGMERLLVYEYVSNSSLDKFIFDSNKRANMDWDMRYKIIEGIARGIIYLHVDSNLRIIHRDLKASNILLDENMNPKISDFGMARLFGVDETQANTNRIVGTYGYMAPEYAFHGHFSIKSDVFSFGVLLLEIVSGQKNNTFQYDPKEEGGDDLLTYAWKIWKDGNYLNLIDPIIFGCSRTEEIIRCAHIGLLCVQENGAKRPTMNLVLNMFNNHAIALAEPSKPALFIESTNSGSAVVQVNNSKSGSVQETTNDEDSM